MSSRVWLRRAYEPPTHNDGSRILVDRIWPRGVTREAAQIDEWMREVAPSNELRGWFGHDVERWEEFQKRYRDELRDHNEEIEKLVSLAEKGRITLVYGARDQKHNQAVVLRDVIEERRAA